jgi:excinuclease ABC subunit C
MKRPDVIIPTSPGSYQFKDASGRIIYVGKALNLRLRLNSYFGNQATMSERTTAMVNQANSVEWIEVTNEIEALLLEHSLIKHHKPRFNIRLRDDKSYPFLSVTVAEKWPRAAVTHSHKQKGVKYFGPYPQAHAMHSTLDLLLQSFPIRSCSEAKFKQHENLGSPCLLYHIKKCSGPCIKAVTQDQYASYVKDFTDVLAGKPNEVSIQLTQKMQNAASDLEFEKAAKFRDQLNAVQTITSKQLMVANFTENMDVIGIAYDTLQVCVQLFFVRNGYVIGKNSYVIDLVEDITKAMLTSRIIERLYDNDASLSIPDTILVQVEPTEKTILEKWLSHSLQSRVQILVPQRGDKRKLLELVTQNASQEMNRNRIRRASDQTTRSKALAELQILLKMPVVPLRIECYDMAHLQGTDYVGSMVVMEDGLPVKSEYRRFKIKTVPGNDDYAAMREVLTRRLTAYLNALSTLTSDTKFSYPPQLILVDGGKGQLEIARQVVSDLGLIGTISIAALAKQFEEVFIVGDPDPINISRNSEALFMLQTIRDEAHRFANKFHRELRDKRMIKSALDDIPGLGASRAKRLIKAFVNVNGVKKATKEELAGLLWLPAAVADSIYKKFHSH